MTIPSIMLGFFNPTITPPGQQAFITAGTFTFTVPIGITSISVVAVGGGGGGAEGANNAEVAGGGGGGGGGGDDNNDGGNGAGGALRIIWGPGRSFPSTSTEDV